MHMFLLGHWDTSENGKRATQCWSKSGLLGTSDRFAAPLNMRLSLFVSTFELRSSSLFRIFRKCAAAIRRPWVTPLSVRPEVGSAGGYDVAEVGGCCTVAETRRYGSTLVRSARPP